MIEHLKPPSSLRLECVPDWNERVAALDADVVADLSEIDVFVLARLAKVQFDLKAAEQAAKEHGAVVVRTNGIPFGSAYAKSRDNLTKEFRAPAKLLGLAPGARKPRPRVIRMSTEFDLPDADTTAGENEFDGLLGLCGEFE